MVRFFLAYVSDDFKPNKKNVKEETKSKGAWGAAHRQNFFFEKKDFRQIFIFEKCSYIFSIIFLFVLKSSETYA